MLNIDELIIQKYNILKNLREVGKKLNISEPTIRKILKKNNINIIKNPFELNLKEEELIKLYNKGNNLKEIAKIFNCSSAYISKKLKNKIIIRRKPKYIEIKEKVCSSCNTLKTINEFHKDKTHIDGFRSKCKLCIKKLQKENRKILSLKEKEKLKIDSNFKILKLLRNRIKQSIKRNSKSIPTKELVGCSIKYLKNYLQQTANQNGYTNFDIDNYSGKEYHIDHIIPCAAFNLENLEEQKKCFHYTNLQILTAKANQLKGDKIDKSICTNL